MDAKSLKLCIDTVLAQAHDYYVRGCGLSICSPFKKSDEQDERDPYDLVKVSMSGNLIKVTLAVSPHKASTAWYDAQDDKGIIGTGETIPKAFESLMLNMRDAYEQDLRGY